MCTGIGCMGGSGTSSGGLGGSNGTLDEKIQEKEKKETDVAGIITASAGGLDSITGLISTFTGKETSEVSNSSNNYIPPPEKKVSPLLIGGIAAGVLVLIIVLILTKNGQAK